MSPSDAALIPVAHVVAKAPGANEALLAMLQWTRSLQGSVLPFTQDWSLSDAVLIGG